MGLILDDQTDDSFAVICPRNRRAMPSQQSNMAFSTTLIDGYNQIETKTDSICKLALKICSE
jgi:hypothetical protein